MLREAHAKTKKEHGCYIMLYLNEDDKAFIRLEGFVRGTDKNIDFHIIEQPNNKIYIIGTVHTHDHDRGLSGRQPDDEQDRGDIQGIVNGKVAIPWYTVGPKSIHCGYPNKYRPSDPSSVTQEKLSSDADIMRDALHRFE